MTQNIKITKLRSYPKSVKFRPMDRLIEERKQKREKQVKLLLEECDKAMEELK